MKQILAMSTGVLAWGASYESSIIPLATVFMFMTIDYMVNYKN